MIALHAALSGDGLLLWGETADGTIADASQLLSGLELVATPLPLRSGRVRKAKAWLPTSGGRPVLSLGLQGPAPRAKIKLAPHSVSAYSLAAGEAVEFLSVGMRGPACAPAPGVGPDLAYWKKAIRFAASLVVRQRYLPSLVGGKDSWHAVWSPVISGDDVKTLGRLAAAMPPSARALTKPGTPSPPATPPLEILQRFVAMAVDALVRSVEPVAAETRSRFPTVHDAWLHALQMADEPIAGDPTELERLAIGVKEWRRPLDAIEDAAYRLCFRLEEPPASHPAGEEPTWYVRYLLHPLDDPSLLIGAEELWRRGGRKTALAKRFSRGAKEYLLAALGQAAGICPPIAVSLERAEPGGYALPVAGAYQFLTAEAMALEDAGFGVLLPSWWMGKGTQTRVALCARVKNLKAKGTSGLSLDDLVRVEWTAALDDSEVSLEELKALANLKVPLVRLRGQWVELDPAGLARAVAFCQGTSRNRATVRDIVQMALQAPGAAPGALDFVRVQATGWLRELLDCLQGDAAFEELPAPYGFAGALRPYQVRGYSWLAFLRRWSLGACLADDMGLGKTVQTLALIQRDWNANGRRPVLLVCPTSVINNWQREAGRFTPDLPVMVHHGPGRGKGADFRKAARECAMVISSYSLIARDLEEFREVEWAGVILDEAQNIKNPETRQARGARSIPADYRAALTGTPVENNVGELWSIMEFLNPGLLGSWSQFSRDFFVPIQAERDQAAAERLKKITGPFILRRLKTDRSIIADLPDKLEMKVFCPLTREQASLYAAVLEDLEAALADAEGIGRKGLVLATLSRLKQVCNHPAHFLGDNSQLPGRSGKLIRLTELLAEVLAMGERALVFSQFAEMGAILQRHLLDSFGREVLFLHGGVAPGQRQRMVDRFQGGGPPIFVLSLKAGGTGLNLTAATHVFHFDRWWNPAVEDQATDRVFRIGQTKKVQVHKFICAGTFEERIDDLIERKRDITNTVIGTGEGWLTELSNRELRDLLALREDAVKED
ncbi:MAG TPA: ATP-dependent helicase [Clostridiales bacterium]|nr:ATP-dependent helicase [Clostridiales bacterium]